MSIFSRTPANEEGPPDSSSAETVIGERGTAAVHRPPSLQSRVSHVLSMALMGAMAVGLIGWFYAKSFADRSAARERAQSSAKGKAQGEMVLPPLGRIDAPVAETRAFEEMLGPAPPVPSERLDQPWARPTGFAAPTYAVQPAAPEDLVLKRKLSGAAFIRVTQVSTAPADVGDRWDVDGADADEMRAGVDSASGAGRTGRTGRAGGGDLDALLTPSTTPAARAEVLPTQTLLLPKGAFVDCTLETAIDSTLPGMTTCITATDTFGVNGKVVLLERGTKLVGETRGQVRQGAARIFVLWAEARTPQGVIVPLASPGTDELGRAGLPGQVNRHFFERFGAAILISVIEGAIQREVQSDNDGGTVIYNPSASQDVMTEVLRSTVNIPPTVVKPQGDRIQVLVARDLDFRSVYELRPVTAGR